MSSVGFTKIAFEPEDFPPPSYLAKDSDSIQNDGNFVGIKPLPPTAIAAPEFVPKTRRFQPPPYLQHFHPQPQFQPQLILPPTQHQGPMQLPYRFPMVPQPFRMRNFLPQLIPINRPPPNRPQIPPGYAADITSLNSSCGGPPIAAIVLRKRRKKKNRSRNKDRQSLQFEDKLSSDGDGHHSDRETDELLHTDKTSEKRRSEPDLMKMLPKDLDSVSSNSTLLQDSLITTSCPDLSVAQKLLLDLHLDELALMEEAYEADMAEAEKNRQNWATKNGQNGTVGMEDRQNLNVKNGQNGVEVGMEGRQNLHKNTLSGTFASPEFGLENRQNLNVKSGQNGTFAEEFGQNLPTKNDFNGTFENYQNGNETEVEKSSSHLPIVSKIEEKFEMELDSNPVVLNAMVDNVYQNSKKSAALKSLDEQIMREMRLKMRENSDSEEELFDRLVNTNTNELLAVGQTNLSLFEEFAEKELFDRLNKTQMRKSHSDNTFASRTLVDNRGKTQLFADESSKEIAGKTENRFNNSSYLDKKSGMQITVNAMNGNETDAMSDDNFSAFSALGSPKSHAESTGSKTNLHFPSSKTCCSVM